MAFGRSHSLSINTGATNSIFSQQQPGQNGTSQPPAAGGLFGGNTSQATQAGGLFGGTTSQPQPTGGLFGGTTNPNTQQQGGTGTGLFGSTLNPPPQQQNQGTGNLFNGGMTNRPNLFSGTGTGAQGTTTGSSLFGGSTAVGSGGGSNLFGGTQQPQQQQQSNLFGGSQQGQQQPTSSILGLTATQPTFQQSMLGANQYRNSHTPQFSGRLTLGQQQNTGTAGSSTTGQSQGAVQINFESMRPSTRFGDIVPNIQQEFERIDFMIQAQERFCREIEAFLPKHSGNMQSLAPDVELIQEKVEGVESALSADAQGVQAERKVLDKDQKDGDRVRRVIDGQRVGPKGWDYGAQQQRISGEDGVMRDTDLVRNYFVPLASDLQETVAAYSSNLAEIEAHMRVIESSAVAQAQELAGRRAGISTPATTDETVKDLADTLYGFETSILGAAGLVGQCREGVNGLLLGR